MRNREHKKSLSIIERRFRNEKYANAIQKCLTAIAGLTGAKNNNQLV